VICLPDDKQSLLEPQHATLSVRRQCDLLGINRSSFYYTVRIGAPLDEEKQALLRLVDEVYTRYPFFGSRQMANYLQLQGHLEIRRHHARWAYKKLGLTSLAPGPHTSKPHPENPVYPYLLRDFSIDRPNQVWSTDLTYIRLGRGFVYLMAIIDWYSRYVLDWELSINMEADFCVETLLRTLSQSRCDIFNTDQGSQFTSHEFTGVLKAHNIKISMDGKGRALDNIFVERLWRSVKYECVYLQEWRTVKEARESLRSYFDFYNNERPHQSLAGDTPRMVHYGKIGG
jgi:putative transposase